MLDEIFLIEYLLNVCSVGAMFVTSHDKGAADRNVSQTEAEPPLKYQPTPGDLTTGHIRPRQMTTVQWTIKD